MKEIPPIKAVMTPFPHFVDCDQPITKALQLMERHGIRHLPVKDGEALVSVITDRDIRAAMGPAVASAPTRRLRVRDVMDREAYVVELSEPLDVVATHMAERRLDCALVVKSERLVGIFTMVDACRCLGGVFRSLFPRGHGDDAA